ncbi:glutaredoxin [bacterium]|nr:glutaredoxin [bacterium]|tara:strand:- start:5491 stop:5766 length:276 start_codon:yes stop_codon:yes gene_type:complete
MVNMVKQMEKMLELYQFEECPYCKVVRTKLTDLGISYIIHNVSREQEERTDLEKISEQKFVPVLVDPNTDMMISDDDEKAVKYLEETYGAE